MRAGLVLLPCLIFATDASAQLAIFDAQVLPTTLAPDAIVVSGDPASCLVPSTLSVAGISPRGSSNGIGSIQTGACRWVISGLAAGAYEIGLTHARGSGGRIRFDYAPGQLTALRIPAPAATVTGVVRINDEPVPGATIMFLAKQNGRIAVLTNAAGAFSASLPEAGPISLRLMGDGVYGQGKKATLAEGANRVDWDITGGTLVVRDARGSRAMSFMVNVGFADGQQGWSAPVAGAVRIMRGAPFGTHTVWVTRGSSDRETIASVTLSPEAPSGEVIIDVP